jgi:hypothetical protein
MKRSKEDFVILTPKTELGKVKLAHHTDKWKLLAKEQRLKVAVDRHSYLRLISRDGSKLMFVRELNDPDFDVRIV